MSNFSKRYNVRPFINSNDSSTSLDSLTKHLPFQYENGFLAKTDKDFKRPFSPMPIDMGHLEPPDPMNRHLKVIS